MMRQCLISVLLENESGALARVTSLFAQRGYNIESLAVAPTGDSTMSHITISTTGDYEKIEQIIKQLNKLIEVIKVKEIDGSDAIKQELMLMKIALSSKDQVPEDTDLKSLIAQLGGSILSSSATDCIVRFIGDKTQIDGCLAQVSQVFRILKVTRSGVLGID